jgi:hypothetical protein
MLSAAYTSPRMACSGISGLPNVPAMWKALSEVAEQTPPLYFLITCTFDQIFRHADSSLKARLRFLPSSTLNR